jgi:hypothetical protein
MTTTADRAADGPPADRRPIAVPNNLPDQLTSFVGRTVKTHLSHVFTKLDIWNRTELARLAAAHRT